MIETSIKEFEGVHYASVDTGKNSVVFHYENSSTVPKVENWLKSRGFMSDTLNGADTLISPGVKECCQSP